MSMHAVLKDPRSGFTFWGQSQSSKVKKMIETDLENLNLLISLGCVEPAVHWKSR